MASHFLQQRDRLIFALDVPSTEEAVQWVDRLSPEVSFFKVGLELFLASGWSIVERIIARGGKVMLDLKLFDIPRTAGAAAFEIAIRGVSLTTVHAGHGPMLEAVCAAVERAGGETKVLAVTVLTSIAPEELALTGASRIEDLAIARARQAMETGCSGIVASPLEASALRAEIGAKALLVTPGIRLSPQAVSVADDQQRVSSPRAALASGASHLVVGRPIREAADPLAVVASIQEEISGDSSG